MEEIRRMGAHAARRPDTFAAARDLLRERSGADARHARVQVVRGLRGRSAVRDELGTKAVDLSSGQSVESSFDEFAVVGCSLRSGFRFKAPQNWRSLQVSCIDDLA